MYSAEELLRVLPKIHVPRGNIWCYTGFTFEEILTDEHMKALLEQCTYLVDGPFIQSKRDITLPFRGSSNQRIIDVRKTIERGEIVTYDI